MAMKARDYQGWGLEKLLQYLETDTGNPLIAMPTGTGKAVMIALFLEYIFTRYPSMKCLVSTHVKELVSQNYKKLKTLWPYAPAGIYSAGVGKRDTAHPIIFNGIQSIAKNAVALFGRVDIMIVDEAHLISPDETASYLKVINALKAVNPKLRVIGLTATPWRLGHGSLVENHIFDKIVYDCISLEAFNWFIEQGYLTPLVPAKTETKLSTDGVHKRGGDFISGELQTAVNKHSLNEPIIREILEHGATRNSGLIFASGVKHAEDLTALLHEMGESAVCIHSEMKGDRDKAIEDWMSGKYKYAVNNNVLTTGIDHPMLDLIAMVRPTESVVLWIQMLGRGTRCVYADGFDLDTAEGRLAAIAHGPKQDCLVLDFSGNTRRLGPINDPVVPRRKGQGGGDAPVKDCPKCGETVHASLRFCNVLQFDGEKCGYEFPIQSKLHFEPSKEELISGTKLPLIEVFKVDHITYTKHYARGNADLGMVKVTYYCGKKSFNEFVCPEHKPHDDGRENYAKIKARFWWKQRTPGTMPDTANEMLDMCSGIKQPTHIRVWVNQKYPEIKAWDFSGTGWNDPKVERSDSAPEIDVVADNSGAAFHLIENYKKKKNEPVTPGFDDPDDDIPF